MILSEQTFIELAGKQEVLDAKIKAAKGITELPLRRIGLYYRVELGECINEMKGDFKHWSDKPMRRTEFIEEFVDCLHFFLSYVNHAIANEFIREIDGLTIESEYRDLMDDYYGYEGYVNSSMDVIEPVDLAVDAISEKKIFKSFAILLNLVKFYGYTEQDIIDTYNEKNKTNHDRSDSGVY